LDPYSIGPCRLGEANDVFNDMDAITSCRLATLRACVARSRVVGSLDNVAARLPRVVEPLRTVVTYCVWAASLCFAGVILQSACPHVLLVFNVSPAALLADAQCRPCHVALWKIRARPDGDHDGHVVRGYLFTLMAHSLLNPHGSHGGSGVALNRERELEPWDTWRLWSCYEPGGGSWNHGTRGGSRAAHLALRPAYGGTRSSGYRQWPLGPPLERLRTRGWGQHLFPCSFSEFCTT
jgi:hypothetical protein